jgi:uncharacterized membrane protein
LKFFSGEEQQSIVDAIRAAERRTSGEIRLHVERKVPRNRPAEGDPYARARELFSAMGMHETAARNGVLVYMALQDRRMAVVGDENLHTLVGESFWEEIVDAMGKEFREERFLQGVNGAIQRIGERLRAHFPHRDDDINELPDEISFEP